MSASPSPVARTGAPKPAAGLGRVLRLGAVVAALRLVWLTMPWTLGLLLGHALDGRSHAFRTVATLGAWVVWALTLVVLLVPRTTSLTAIRVLVPATLPAAVWAALASDVGAETAVGLAAAAVATALALAAPVADAFADGSSYGDERRLVLRTPAALLLGPVELTWAVCVAGVAAGPLLLAARLWVAGAVALVVGLPLAGLAARSLHQLSRRWVVFVPAGFVLHDHLATAEPVLFQRRQVQRLAPAEVSTDALDLSSGAPGLTLEARLLEPHEIGLRRGRATSETTEIEAFLFTPGRPGELLAEARRRKFAVG